MRCKAVCGGSPCGSVHLPSSAGGSVRLSDSGAVCDNAAVCIFSNNFEICPYKFDDVNPYEIKIFKFECV
jgi:hypothetical protein